MKISVVCDRHQVSDPESLINNDNPQLWCQQTLPLSDALARVWDTDAHFSTYWVERDGQPYEYIPRLHKGCLAAVRAAGLTVLHGVVVADVDCPRHGLMTDELLEDARARLEGKNCAWYPTRGGLRVLRPTTVPIRSEEWEIGTVALVNEVRGWFDANGGEADWRVDMLAAWPWLYRCPNVTRDGVQLRASVYELDTVVPAEVSYPDAPAESPRRVVVQRTPEEIARLAQQLQHGLHPWVRSQLRKVCEDVAQLGTGTNRHVTLLGVARRFGGHVASGEAKRDVVEAALYEAIRGWPWGSAPHFVESDYQRCIRDGIDIGLRDPITVPEEWQRVATAHAEGAELQRQWDAMLEDVKPEPVRPRDAVGPVIGTINESDLGNARELFLIHQDRIRVAGKERTPMWWDDETGLWREGLADLIMRAGLLLDEKVDEARRVLEELGDETPGDDDETKRARRKAEQKLKWWKSCQTASKLRSMVTLALAHRQPTPWAEFDGRADLLPFDNGVLELKTGRLRPLQPADMFTQCIGYAFDPNAKAPLWERSLAAWQPDPEIRGWLQRRAGTFLSGDTAEQILTYHYGPSGTGKSTFIESIVYALGPFAAKLPRSVYEKPHGPVGHPTDVWRLRGLRLAYATELSPYLYVERLNELTGCEMISARGMNKDFGEFRPLAKHELMSHERPKIPKDLSNGMWRRIALIPWKQRFRDVGADVFVSAEDEGDAAPQTRNKQIFEQLRAEAPGILAWLYRGYQAWLTQPLMPFPAAIAAGVRALAAGDTLDFMGTEFEKDPDAKVLYSLVWATRQRWNQQNKEGMRESSKAFSSALKKAGIKTEQQGKRNTTYVLGWRVSLETDEGGDFGDVVTPMDQGRSNRPK